MRSSHKNEAIELGVQRTEHRVSDFLEQNSQTLTYVGLGGLALLILIFAFSGRGGAAYTNIPEAYRSVPKEISQLTKNLTGTDALNSTLKNYPEIAARYDAKISQILLSQGNAKAAAPFFNRQLERVQTYVNPTRTAFAKTSLLIAEGQHREALQQAKELKETLAGVDNSYLTALNLLRIASLESVVGTSEGERWAWHELGVYLDKVENGAIHDKLNAHFQNGKIGLKQFIEVRNKEIAKVFK